MEPRVLYRCFYIAPFLIKLRRIQIAYSQIVSSVQISAVKFQKAYSWIYQQEAHIPTGIEHHNKCVRGRDPRVVDSVESSCPTRSQFFSVNFDGTLCLFAY